MNRWERVNETITVVFAIYLSGFDRETGYSASVCHCDRGLEGNHVVTYRNTLGVVRRGMHA